MTQQVRQIQISIDELKQKKFFIATPMYGGNCMEPYFRSAIKLLTFFNKHDIPLAWGTIANESLITRARNVLLAYFLKSNYDYLMFIDGDIEYDVNDVLKLYAHDKDIVVGAYPKKGINWRRIVENSKVVPQIPNEDKEIASWGSDYAVNFKFLDKDAKTIQVENGLVKLHDAGTGFMMIKREAILKLIKAYPELKYNNDVSINDDVHDYFYALFDTMIDPIDKRYLSEDYTFCRRWQDIGGDVYLDPSISLNHYGHAAFQGNPSNIINFGSNPFDGSESENPPNEWEMGEEIQSIELPD